MRVLVSGGAGYIGSHTSNLLVKNGYRVMVIDDLSTGFNESLDKEVEFLCGDITNIGFLESVFEKNKYDALIHFAAKLVVPDSVINPHDYYLTNVIGSMNLFSQCAKNGIENIVFSSTAAVYGDGISGLVTEDTICNPINPYGNSKYLTENMLLDFSKAYGLRPIILRYFNVAGGNPDLSNGQKTRNATHLIKVAAEAACGKRDFISIFGTDYPTPDGTCIRDYIHVLDLAHAHLSALEYLHQGGSPDIFNCGYGKGFSVLEVLTTMKRVSGVDFDVRFSNKRTGDPISLIADNMKIRKKLKWLPQYNNIDLICKTAYNWENQMYKMGFDK